jgi:predicted AAA+ superfamily ATPase
MRPSEEAIKVVCDLNPWWREPRDVRPHPPSYRRPVIRDLVRRLKRPQGLVEVIRGPRQVGKTTGIYQIVQDLIATGTPSTDLLLIRFDLELLREERGTLRNLFDWYVADVRRRPAGRDSPCYLFLDEVHKLARWSEEVKHLGDTFPVRMLLTGSSSAVVAKGGRESLAGRAFTSELPTFSFREVLECWHPRLAAALPPAISWEDVFAGGLEETADRLIRLRPQQRLAIKRQLERYFNRGGYPRLHSGEVEDDRWADYLVQTIFENVLGADIPDLFPVENPGLLRHLYLSVARQTGQILPQTKLAEAASAAGIPTNQPTVRNYLHYLADSLLVREFRHYPLAKKQSARVPAKISVSDLGVRNAIFRGAPSLWESDPVLLGPLVETMVQAAIRGPNLQVHYYRENENPRDRKSRIMEVDFVAERIDGQVVPIEVKFRKRIDAADWAGITHFRRRFDSPVGVLVTRDADQLGISGDPLQSGKLQIPLQDFLLAF